MATLVRFRQLTSYATLKRLSNTVSFTRTLHAAPCIQRNALLTHTTRVSSFTFRPVVTAAAVRSGEQTSPHQQDQWSQSGPLSEVDRRLETLDRQARNWGRITREDVEETLKAVRAFGSVTSQQGLMLLRSLGSLMVKEHPDARHEMFKQLWAAMPELCFNMNIAHYNVALRIQLENGQKFDVTEFLAEIEASKNIVPNRITHQLLIARYCEDGDIDGASKVLEYMKSQDMPINESVFNALVKGHMRSDDPAGAREVLTSMKECGLDPTANTYKQLMCGYAARSDIDSIKQVLSEASEDGVFLQSSHLFEVVFQLARAGQPEMMTEIIDVIQQRHGFNHDAANCMFRLVALGDHDDDAYRIYMCMERPQATDPRTSSLGRILIRSMMIAGRPIEKIFEIYGKLQADGLMLGDSVIMAMWALKFQRPYHAMYIFRHMHENNIKVKPHYFWPIFKTLQNVGDKDGIYAAMKTLDDVVDTDMQSIVTLYHHAMTPLRKMGDDFDTILAKLQDSELSSKAMRSLQVVEMIAEGKLDDAVTMVRSGDCLLPASLLKLVLTSGFRNSNQDVTNVTELLLCADELADHHLLDLNSYVLLSLLKHGQLETAGAEQLVNSYVQKNLQLMNRSIAAITSQLKHLGASDESIQSLSKLRTAPTQQTDVASPGLIASEYMAMSIEDIEKLLSEYRAKNANVKSIEKWLLSKYCSAGNVDKALEIKASLDSQGFVYHAELLRQLGYLAAREQGDLDLALKYKHQMEEQYPDFSSYVSMLLLIATLQVKENKAKDAVSMLTAYAHRHGAELAKAGYADSYTLGSMCETLLSAARECGGESDDTKMIMDTLFDLGFMKRGAFSLLSQNIGANIDRQDMDGMLEALRVSVNEYGRTPMFSDVFRALIKREDAERLQTAVDLVTTVHGEMNVLLHLLISFIECGKLKQARKILETPGLRAVMSVLKGGCARFLTHSMTKEMGQLVDITKDLFAIDRDEMLFNQIRLYAKLNDYKKAMDVYITYEEENITPRLRTLRYLAKVLETHNQEVPFDVPRTETRANSLDHLTDPRQKKVWSLVQGHDLEQFAELYQTAKDGGEGFSAEFLASIGRALCSPETEQQFKRYVHELGDQGELESLLLLRQHRMPTGKSNFVHQRILRAYIQRGQVEELLTHLIANPSQVSVYMSARGIMLLAEKQPQHMEKLELAIQRYTEEGGQTKAVHHMFTYYCLSEQFNKARQLLDTYPQMKNDMRLIFLCSEAESEDKEGVLKNVLDLVEDMPKQFRAIPYGHLIRMKCNQGSWQDALAYYQTAIASGLQTSELWNVAVASLERVLTDNEQPIPWPAGTLQFKPADTSNAEIAPDLLS